MRRRDALGLFLVASVLVVAPFALGGAPRWALCLTSGLAAVAAAAFVTSQRELSQPPPLLVFVGLAAALTLVQVVPLPAAVVALISPGKHALVADNARALGEATPAWIPLSLDPPATLIELAKYAGYVAFAYAALRIAAQPARRPWLLSIVAVVGIAMAATTLLHLLVGAESVFGLYRPQQALIRPTLAPLLNHNHLSALMALSAPIAVGLALAAPFRRRLAWLGGAALCAAVGLLAESRGGALALVIGLVTVGVLALLQRGAAAPLSKLRRSDVVAIAVVALSGLVLLGALTAGGVVRDLSGTQLAELDDSQSRFGVWRSSAALLSEFRWTGIGRGAFEMASTRVHDSSAVIYPYVENEYLQAAVDWGFVGAGALALVLVWLATTGARRARASTWEAGAFAGLAALAVENLTDFSLWMPGVAYPALGALAVLTAGPIATHRLARRRWMPVRAAAIALIAIAVVVAASPLATSARVETAALAARRKDPDAWVTHARRVFARHPSDYAAAGHVARALFAARDRRAIAVANRALSLHPTSGELHRLTAQMLLASQQRDQAGVEYALALRYRPRSEVLDEIVAVFPADPDLVRALPVAPSLVRELADRLAERGRVPAVLAYLQRYLALYPDDGRVLLYTSSLATAAGDRALATAAARRAHELDPTANATIVLARALAGEAQADRALTLLQNVLDHPTRPVAHTERVEILGAIAEIQATLGKVDAARESLRTALGLTGGAAAARLHRRLADLEDQAGNKHQASWERQRAAELER